MSLFIPVEKGPRKLLIGFLLLLGFYFVNELIFYGRINVHVLILLTWTLMFRPQLILSHEKAFECLIANVVAAILFHSLSLHTTDPLLVLYLMLGLVCPCILCAIFDAGRYICE